MDKLIQQFAAGVNQSINGALAQACQSYYHGITPGIVAFAMLLIGALAVSIAYGAGLEKGRAREAMETANMREAQAPQEATVSVGTRPAGLP